MRKLMFMAGAYTMLFACPPTSNCDTAGNNCTTDTSGTDTDTNTTGPLLINSVDHNCANSQWTYTVVANGVTSGGSLYITQDTSQPWQETHDLTGNDGINLGLSLGVVTSMSDQHANSTSLFTCDMENLMGWKAQIFSPTNTNEVTDCVVWSGSATTSGAMFSSDIAGGCSDANTW